MSSLSLPFLFLCSVFNVLFSGVGPRPPPDSPLAFRQRGVFVGMNPPKNFIQSGLGPRPPGPRQGGRSPSLWWRRTESNCRPPACKAGALPAELRPHIRLVRPSPSRSHSPLQELVGPSGLEPPTSRLSVVRSSQLSYGPIFGLCLPRFEYALAHSKLNNAYSNPTRTLSDLRDSGALFQAPFSP